MVDLLLVGSCLAGGLVGGGLVNLFVHAPILHRIKRLEGYVGSIGTKELRSEKNQEEESEMIAAITEAAELHSQGKQIPEIIKEIGLKHPSVAMKFIKMFLSGKLKLPAGLGGF